MEEDINNQFKKAVLVTFSSSSSRNKLNSSGLIISNMYLITSLDDLYDQATQNYPNSLQLVYMVANKCELPVKKRTIQIKNIQELNKIESKIIIISIQEQIGLITSFQDVKKFNNAKLILQNIGEDLLSQFSSQPPTQISSCSQQMSQFNEIRDIADQLQKSFSFIWDKSTHYAIHFNINDKMASRKDYDGQFYQITNNQPLPQNKMTTINLLFHSYGGQSSTWFGIITKNLKNQPSTWGRNSKSVCYDCNFKTRTGAIWNDGKQVQIWGFDVFVEVGCILQMKVDLNSYRITFLNKSKSKEFGYLLNKQDWNNKEIYFFVVMKDKGDCIEILE